MKGLTRGMVSVVQHDDNWERDAKDCIALLEKVLQHDIVDAQHVGSTSIIDICAKPIIDIVVGVKDFQDILRHNEELTEQGIYYY